ncbi:hypothetical protein MMC14_004228, partial [Varicellaria rhodocarpa]|nr:hypothetical protein [Varicellaria rhodocarpa]
MFAKISISLLLASAAGFAVAMPATPTADAPFAKRTTHTGRGTTYDQGGAAGSCGTVYPDSAIICALGTYWMDQSPNYCGRTIQAKNVGSNDGVGGNGNTVTVKVVDTCESCGEGDVDFSLGAWNELTNNAAPGTFSVS